MQIGMNLLLWTTNVTQKQYPVLEKIKQWGFDGVEVPLIGASVNQVKRLAKQLDNLGLKRTAVSVMPPGASPISGSAKARKTAVDLLRATLDQCNLLGATVLAGPIVQTLGEFTNKPRTQAEWDRCVAVLQRVAPDAAQADVTLAVEFLNRFEIYFLNTTADAAQLVREVGHPNCQMMFDFFHANIEEKDSAKAIRAARKEIAHVHISESDRGIPGTGQVKWAEGFKALRSIKYDGWLTIESFSTALPDLAAAAKIWRPLFKSEDEVARKGIRFIRKMWDAAG